MSIENLREMSHMRLVGKCASLMEEAIRNRKAFNVRFEHIATLEARVKELETDLTQLKDNVGKGRMEELEGKLMGAEKQCGRLSKMLFDQKDNRGDVGPQD